MKGVLCHVRHCLPYPKNNNVFNDFYHTSLSVKKLSLEAVGGINQGRVPEGHESNASETW